MLNPKLKLNPKLFDKKVEQLPTRNGYGEGLLELGDTHEDVVALCADLTESTRTEAFAKKFPNRFFEMGVAEQNLATVAAGLGISGKIPFITSYATFSPGRNWEQIRTTICYNNSNVKVIGCHTGLSVGPDGATHQALEDIALMRVLPNMKVFVPCDILEAKKITKAIADVYGPCYLRLTREKTPVITTEKSPFTLGKGDIFWQSKNPKVVIFACGPVIYEALLAAHDLEKENIEVEVICLHSVKPLDHHLILDAAKKVRGVVVVEEHQVAGGLGSAIAELLVQSLPKPMKFIGIEDSFGESGTPEELLLKYGISGERIKAAVKKLL